MLKKIILAAAITFTAAGSFLFLTHSISAYAQGSGMWGSPDRGWWEEWHGPHMRPWHKQRMERHWRFMHGEVPEKYRNMVNPVEFNTANIQAGGELYRKACAQCHGKEGMGDGEAAKNLRPSPALLAYLIQRPIAADSYLMWTISEGGVENKTDMPAFKDTLSPEEIWKIIVYMHSGFPKIEDKK